MATTHFTPGTIVLAKTGNGTVIEGRTYEVLAHSFDMVDVKDVITGEEHIGSFDHRFEVAPTPTFNPGAKFTINVDQADSANVRAGDTGTLVRLGSSPDTWHVKMDNIRSSYHTADDDFHWSIMQSHMRLVAGPVKEATLEEFRVKFIDGARARAARNSSAHVEQVEALLTALALDEFRTPTTDLLEFKKKVVAKAMEGKKIHGWCDEPEKFLASIGLSDLTPTRKRVTVTLLVEVEAAPGDSDYTVRMRASDLIVLPNTETDYVTGTRLEA